MTTLVSNWLRLIHPVKFNGVPTGKRNFVITPIMEQVQEPEMERPVYPVAVRACLNRAGKKKVLKGGRNNHKVPLHVVYSEISACNVCAPGVFAVIWWLVYMGKVKHGICCFFLIIVGKATYRAIQEVLPQKGVG